MEVVHAPRGLADGRDDEIAVRHARLGRGTAALDAQDLDARVLCEPEPPRRAACERSVLPGDAEEAAAHAAVVRELSEHPPRGDDRDAEAEPLRAEDHRRVDADDARAADDQLSAGVA